MQNYEHLFGMADAYITCSLHLFTNVANGELERNYFLTKACISLYRNAIEVFLKFTIIVASDVFPITHKLNELYNLYWDFYPEEKFQFQADILGHIKENEAYPLNIFSNNLVYEGDDLSVENSRIEIISWLENVKIAKDEFARLKPLIIAKYKK
jgi:hypothetical protein